MESRRLAECEVHQASLQMVNGLLQNEIDVLDQINLETGLERLTRKIIIYHTESTDTCLATSGTSENTTQCSS